MAGLRRANLKLASRQNVVTPSGLDGPDAELVEAALAASANAHAPYSDFHVGAAVRSATGAVYLGANVENVSYPVGVCAESVALAAARTAEGARFKLDAVAVVATDAQGVRKACSPCGACRQRILEFSADAPVLFFDADQKLMCEPASALLPHGFTFKR